MTTPRPTVTIKPHGEVPILKSDKWEGNGNRKLRKSRQGVTWSNGGKNGPMTRGSIYVKEYDPENSPSQILGKNNIPQ
jgi:hypothetical protein